MSPPTQELLVVVVRRENKRNQIGHISACSVLQSQGPFASIVHAMGTNLASFITPQNWGPTTQGTVSLSVKYCATVHKVRGKPSEDGRVVWTTISSFSLSLKASSQAGSNQIPAGRSCSWSSCQLTHPTAQTSWRVHKHQFSLKNISRQRSCCRQPAWCRCLFGRRPMTTKANSVSETVCLEQQISYRSRGHPGAHHFAAALSDPIRK